MLRSLVLNALVISLASSFNVPKLTVYQNSGNNVGYPSFVTPFIEKNMIKEGQENCTVSTPLKGKIKSYAGFFTVRKMLKDGLESNMFFWYFPAENNSESAPVVLWLQGGPGATSLYGLFEEIGPFSVKKSHGLKLRKYHWTQSLNVLFIDNPVGTGFSYTTNDKGYAKNEDDVAKDLYQALLQFFVLFPNLQKNSFFVSGESYAGKYVPALAYKIDRSNEIPGSQVKINLKGITIGNGLCDPENMLQYGDYLYQIGLIDSNGLSSFKKKENEVRGLIQKGEFEKAYYSFDTLLNGDLTDRKKTLFYNLTRFENYFDYRHSKDVSPFGDFGKYVQSDLVRRFIHVGNITFQTENLKVEQNLRNDVMQSVKPFIENLLPKYRVLIYNGQFDIIVAYPLTVNFLKTLKWPGADQYMFAKRRPLMIGAEIAGYYKTAKNLVEVVVRDAGHMVPKDQPYFALELITRFMNNKPLSD